jgi:RNA ligase
MAILADVLDVVELATDIEEGLVNRQTDGSLAILNYTHLAQFSNKWTRTTMACRGLIYDSDTTEVVARPFPKFFNYGQGIIPHDVTTKRPIVTEKADGSLGIIYWCEDAGRWKVATRGSFSSDQAVHATIKLRDYIDVLDEDALAHDRTYLVEIIYPGNRIVVDYAGRDELRLLAVIDIETGGDYADVNWPGPRVEMYTDIKDVQSAYMITTSGLMDDAEGMVLCYPRYKAPSFRLKVKSLEYLRLHKLLTGLSTKKIYDHLANGRTVESLIEDVPDEFMEWVNKEATALTEAYDEILVRARFDFAAIEGHCETRAEFAKFALKTEYSDILFRMYDGRDFADLIWKRIKPEFRLFAEDDGA